MSEETGRGYTQGGAGEYPLSEPETRAVFDLPDAPPERRHRAVARHGGADDPAGPSTSKSEESMFPDDLELIKKFDAEGAGDHRLSVGRRHLLRLRDARRRRTR